MSKVFRWHVVRRCHSSMCSKLLSFIAVLLSSMKVTNNFSADVISNHDGRAVVRLLSYPSQSLFRTDCPSIWCSSVRAFAKAYRHTHAVMSVKGFQNQPRACLPDAWRAVFHLYTNASPENCCWLRCKWQLVVPFCCVLTVACPIPTSISSPRHWPSRSLGHLPLETDRRYTHWSAHNAPAAFSLPMPGRTIRAREDSEQDVPGRCFSPQRCSEKMRRDGLLSWVHPFQSGHWRYLSSGIGKVKCACALSIRHWWNREPVRSTLKDDGWPSDVISGGAVSAKKIIFSWYYNMLLITNLRALTLPIIIRQLLTFCICKRVFNWYYNNVGN